MKFIKPLIFFLLTLNVLSLSAQELKLPRLFSDKMVLQREAPVRFWGWGKPGGQIMVSIDDFTVKSKVDKNGNWECLFPAHEAGGPFQVIVYGDAQVTYEDVYFGDVWVASGQSNMEWKISGDIVGMEETIADSNYPEIRFFEVPKRISPAIQNDLEGGEWKIANTENSPEFSAVAWFFAKKNHLEKNVPVGVVSSYWGGTPAEAWTSIGTLNGVEGYKESAAEVLDPANDWETIIADNEEKSKKKWEMIWDKEGSISTGANQLDFDDSDWQNIELPNADPMSDFVWVRKKVEIKSVKSAKLSLGRLTNLGTVYINGTEVLDRKWEQLKTIEIPDGVLVSGENLIAIRAVNDWDNRVTIGKSGDFNLQIGKKTISLEGTWKYSNSVEPKMPDVQNFSWKPSFLFNGMIKPIAGYSIKGVIWYQGESNVGQHQYYRTLFGEMIRDWREYWKQGNFPFLFVQLANWQARQPEPSESGWAALQEAQTQTLELPNTGMATIIDIGEADDIHPRNKKDVGERLWLSARKVAFGEDLIYSGPMYAGHSIAGNKVTINYDHVGSGLEIRGESLTGFAMAGEDKKFYWAQGQIEGDKIVISSDQVDEPKYIRYAWADNPACNLYNKEGLPAIPFRTDQ